VGAREGWKPEWEPRVGKEKGIDDVQLLKIIRRLMIPSNHYCENWCCEFACVIPIAYLTRNSLQVMTKDSPPKPSQLLKLIRHAHTLQIPVVPNSLEISRTDQEIYFIPVVLLRFKEGEVLVYLWEDAVRAALDCYLRDVSGSSERI
jgi:hypothetical protein